MPKTTPAPAHVSVAGLKARGWTEALITAFLREPDKVVDNPHYRSAAPMRLYALARVEQVEGTDAYRQAAQAAAPRRQGARQAAQTKRAQLLAAVDALQIRVPVYEQGVLVERACAHYNWRQAEREWQDWSEPATTDSHPAFLERITVNFLRHALTSYEGELAQVYGKVGVREAYRQINQKVYAAIAAAYPCFAEECQRQLARKGEEWYR